MCDFSSKKRLKSMRSITNEKELCIICIINRLNYNSTNQDDGLFKNSSILLICNKFSRSLMWKLFVTGPFSIRLTYNMLLKNQKENNLPTFFN